MMLEAIDRGLTELLRTKVVKRGYLPDVTLYPTIGDYRAAKKETEYTMPVMNRFPHSEAKN